MRFTPQKLDGGHGFADGEPVADLLRRQRPQHDGGRSASHRRPFPALGLTPPAPRDRAPQPGGGAEGRRPPCCGGRRGEGLVLAPVCASPGAKRAPVPVTTRSAAPSRSLHEARPPPGPGVRHHVPPFTQRSNPQARSRLSGGLPAGAARSPSAPVPGGAAGSRAPLLRGCRGRCPGGGGSSRAGASPSRRPPQRHRRLSPLRDLRRPPRSSPALRVGAAGGSPREVLGEGGRP